jgi:hypothetical protein
MRGGEHFAIANDGVAGEGIVTSRGQTGTDSRGQGKAMLCAMGTPGIMR